MTEGHVAYKIVPNPRFRRWLAEAFGAAHHKNTIHGLIEVDVTSARAILREQKARTGESLSFTAFLIGCVGKAVDENRAVQAFRKGSKRLMLFDEVAVYYLIERDVAGQKQPIPAIIRAANRKTVGEIHDEIRSAQVQDVGSVMGWLQFLPGFLFGPFHRIFSWIGKRYPQMWRRFVGTVGITSVGMFGDGAGWGIPTAVPTLMITVGGIGRKPGVVGEQIAIREYLSLTISFDHDVVDGAPAARFIRRLKELIESGYGLAKREAENAVSLPV